MKIFYDKATGETVGSVDGFSDDIEKMSMSIPGVDIGEVNIHLNHPDVELAKRVMEPTDPLGVFDLHFDDSDKSIKPMPEDKLQERAKKREENIKAGQAWAKAHPVRDYAKEIDDLKAEIVSLKSAKPNKP